MSFHLFNVSPIVLFCLVNGPCFVVSCLVSLLVFAIIFYGKKRASWLLYFNYTWMSCDCSYSVFFLMVPLVGL